MYFTCVKLVSCVSFYALCHLCQRSNLSGWSTGSSNVMLMAVPFAKIGTFQLFHRYTLKVLPIYHRRLFRSNRIPTIFLVQERKHTIIYRCLRVKRVDEVLPVDWKVVPVKAKKMGENNLVKTCLYVT